MDEPLFEIENWRGGWYYKLGSRYTGPYKRRDMAVEAAQSEIDPLMAPSSISLRTSLARQRPAAFSPRGIDGEKKESAMSLGMTFRISGAGGYA